MTEFGVLTTDFQGLEDIEQARFRLSGKTSRIRRAAPSGTGDEALPPTTTHDWPLLPEGGPANHGDGNKRPKNRDPPDYASTYGKRRDDKPKFKADFDPMLTVGSTLIAGYLSGSIKSPELLSAVKSLPALPAPPRSPGRPPTTKRPTQWDDVVKTVALVGLFALACASPIPGDEIAVAAIAAPVIFI